MTAERTVKECLESAVQEFHSSPLSAQLMRRFAKETPDLFARVVVSMLATASDTAGFRYLAMLLIQLPTLFKQLSDPGLFTHSEVITLSRHLIKVDPSFDVRFARQLPARNGTVEDTIEGKAAERALDILDEISPGKRVVPILSHLIRHTNSRVSAKATLLIGKRVQNVAFARRLLTEETDSRVCADAIEAIWGNDSHLVQELFWAITYLANHLGRLERPSKKDVIAKPTAVMTGVISQESTPLNGLG